MANMFPTVCKLMHECEPPESNIDPSVASARTASDATSSAALRQIMAVSFRISRTRLGICIVIGGELLINGVTVLLEGFLRLPYFLPSPSPTPPRNNRHRPAEISVAKNCSECTWDDFHDTGLRRTVRYPRSPSQIQRP